ncbi:tyrosine-protein kinase Dnt-like isoform X2 [Lycorma delicatula]|uniref:tyrosine-protein kinase Dnt-like isoform X2 n=1 Tax=Lycorma delicatula TaxID=130591 RepID=UPI003F511DC5
MSPMECINKMPGIATLLLTTLFSISCDAYFNLFISQDEIRKLLGINASELYYVREGVVNTYAMNFVVLLPTHISDLQFYWQALTRHPMPYVWTVEYNNVDAMLPPSFSISRQGLVPFQVEPFYIRFPCTGLRSAEVHVLLQLNVSAQRPLHSDTSINFRRNKICSKVISEDVTPRNDSIRLDPSSLGSSAGTFYIAVSCACALILVIIVISSLAYVKSNKANTQDSLHTSYTSGAYAGNPNLFIRMDSIGSGSYATIASLHKSSASPYATSCVTADTKGRTTHHIYAKPRVSYYASSQLTQMPQLDPEERLRRLHVPRHRIAARTLLQEGTFGRIYRGTFYSEDDSRTHDVVIKTVSEEASRLQESLLLSEGTLLYGFSHQNILPVLGANTDAHLPPLLVYPYTNKGNLKRFLHKCSAHEEQYTLLTPDLVGMATQVAAAGVFLANQRLCHKDLAARNCVVDDKLRVRVADSGLARDLFPGDYHCLGDNENRPIKWLAIESLTLKQFTSASDVWSFGVLMWELVTLGQQPFAEVDPFEVAAYLRDGYRLSQPPNCPDELFDVMTWCWQADPDERPSFFQLFACLEEFNSTLGAYI